MGEDWEVICFFWEPFLIVTVIPRQLFDLGELK